VTRRLLLPLPVVLLALSAPSVAQADDGSLFRAYDANQSGALATSLRHYEAHAKRLDRTGDRRWARALIKDDRDMDRALADIGSDLRREPPSSDNGRIAKRFALKEIAAWQAANHLEMRALRARSIKRSRRLAHRGSLIMIHKTKPYGTRAVKAFRAAGFHSANGSLLHA
jgi:hypothetical protein